MRSILEELWYGNVCPNGECRELIAEAKKFMKYIADHHDNFQATLTDKQKEVLEKFDDCYAELTDINEREIFVYAFRLGARIAIEVLSRFQYLKRIPPAPNSMWAVFLFFFAHGE